MEIGEQITIGRLGQQALHITDPSVDPEHAILRRTGVDTYQIEDRDSTRGVFVFGLRIMRKTVKAQTPILLGTFKTTVEQLLQDIDDIDLADVWGKYDKEKQKWDRYTLWVNSIRMLSPVVTMVLAQVIEQNWLISVAALVAVLLISMIAGEKVLAKKNIRMAELNAMMQTDYACPHCHKFLGYMPYKVLKEHGYCPACGSPLP